MRSTILRSSSSHRTDDKIATAGGCLASQYLAAWIIHRSLGRDAVVEALSYVAPVGEAQNLVERALTVIESKVAIEI